MDEHYHWKLKALAHDAREIRAAKTDVSESFSTVYPYICELTDDDLLYFPKLYWNGRVPKSTVEEFSRRPPPPPSKTLCEEAYRIASHLVHIRHTLQLAPLLDDPCEAWFTKVVPHVLGKEKAPPQPSRWKCIELNEEHLQALEATNNALEILARQLDETAGASDSAGQNAEADKEEKHLTFISVGPFNIEQGDKEPQTTGESVEAEPKVNTVSIGVARKWFRERVKDLARGAPDVSLEDKAVRNRLIRP